MGSRARWNKWNDCAARSSVCRQYNQRSFTHKDTVRTYAHDDATFQMHACTTALMQTFLHTRMQTTLAHTYVFIGDSRSVSFTCALQVPPSHQQTETCAIISTRRSAICFIALSHFCDLLRTQIGGCGQPGELFSMSFSMGSASGRIRNNMKRMNGIKPTVQVYPRVGCFNV